MSGMLSESVYRATRLIVLLVVPAVVISGCTAKYYRKSADKETYRIIQDYDKRVFGVTNPFTIDTPYSKRDPKTILPGEIIADRTATNRRVLNLDQALDLAVERSREYQSQKEKLYLTALTLTGARYELARSFSPTRRPRSPAAPATRTSVRSTARSG